MTESREIENPLDQILERLDRLEALLAAASRCNEQFDIHPPGASVNVIGGWSRTTRCNRERGHDGICWRQPEPAEQTA